MKWLCRFVCAITLVSVTPLVSNVFAKSFPTRPVHIVVGYPPGGSLDMVARSMGQELKKEWTQPVIVENRPGAGANIAAGVVARSTPNGYTLLLTSATLALSHSLYHHLPFNAVTAFAPVTELCSTFLVLVANSRVPAHSLKQLVALAKSEPGKLNYGTTGLGSANQMIMGELTKKAHVNIVGIPYKGMAPLSNALLSGRVDMALVSLDGTLKSYIKAGKLRPLAITSKTRSPLLPHVPTMAEEGLAGVVVPNWFGLFAPAGTPRSVIRVIQRDAVQAVRTHFVRNRIRSINGAKIVGSGTKAFNAKFQGAIKEYARIVAEQHIPKL